MKQVIIPSLIANNQTELDKIIKEVNFAKKMQIDIMDGKFVKNKSFDFNFVLPSAKKYEAHLMIVNPLRWIKVNFKKIDTIIFQIEAVKNPSEIIEFVKFKNKKVGIAINPKTSVKKILPYLDMIDMVLVMTVNPGKYGSKFLPKTLEKVKVLRKIKPKLNLEVDGGIDDKTIGLASKAGASSFISGSYLQKNSKNGFEKLKKMAS